MQEPIPPNLAERTREWLGVLGALSGVSALVVLVGRPMLASLRPVEIIPQGKAHVSKSLLPFSGNEISVEVEVIKRTSGHLLVYAFIEGMRYRRLELVGSSHYSQWPIGRSYQSLDFGLALQKDNYPGKRLVIVVEGRMRKGRLAMVRKVPIE